MPSTPLQASSAFPSQSNPMSPSPSFSPNAKSPNPIIIPQNYHPYKIQSTSSSLLTRSNSSPLQPVNDYRHRPSRSMSSLSHSVSDGNLSTSAKEDEGTGSRSRRKEDAEGRRRSIDGSSPAPPRLRRSGTLPVFPREEDVTPTKDAVTDNPKQWTPAQLARYLSRSLRTGDCGYRLPTPLVKDIEAWVLRQQVTGRAFLKGQSEGWATSSRAPPFLPLLLSISRRLRRSSLQARLGEIATSPLPQHDSPGSSVLIEAEEDDVEEEDEDEETGVRRMARAIERPLSAASSASSASAHMDHVLRPQHTGESDTNRNLGWKAWDVRGGGWVGRRRKESGASTSSFTESVAEFRSAAEERKVSGGSTGSNESGTSGTSGLVDEQLQTPLDVATIKAPPVGLGLGVGDDKDVLTIKKSPPPPYDGPSILDTFAAPLVDSDAVPGLQVADKPQSPNTQRGSRRGPSLKRLRQAQALLDADDPSFSAEQNVQDGEEADDEQSQLATARRVTLRPSAADVFGSRHGANPGRRDVDRSAKEEEMEKEVRKLTERVKELEGHLAKLRSAGTASASKASAPRPASVSLNGILSDVEQISLPITGMSNANLADKGDADAKADADANAGVDCSRNKTIIRPSSPLGDISDSILGRLGLLPEQDGLPTRFRELPAYLFLVGVGVGAVMVRVLFSRGR